MRRGMIFGIILVVPVIFTDSLQGSYDYSTGRWLTQDPLGYQAGLNLYTYSRNDPPNSLDPMGLQDYLPRIDSSIPITTLPPIKYPSPYDPDEPPQPPISPRPISPHDPDPEWGGPDSGFMVYCNDIQEFGEKQCFRPIGRCFGFQHCDVRAIPSGPLPGKTNYPVWRDNSCERRMWGGFGIGTKCCNATHAQILDCQNKVQNYDKWSLTNNCHTMAASALARCCLKSRWTPPWYAFWPGCLRWEVRCHSGYGTRGERTICEKVCVEWESYPQ